VTVSAGTSKGSEDFSHSLLAEKGELIFHGVKAAPGRPIAVAIAGNKPIINVAGPPIACFNGFDWCVSAVVRAYLRLPKPIPKTVKAKLTAAISDKGGGPFEGIKRVRVTETAEGYEAYPLSMQDPVSEALRANGQYVTKLTPEPCDVGDIIEVEILR